MTVITRLCAMLNSSSGIRYTRRIIHIRLGNSEYPYCPRGDHRMHRRGLVAILRTYLVCALSRNVTRIPSPTPRFEFPIRLTYDRTPETHYRTRSSDYAEVAQQVMQFLLTSIFVFLTYDPTPQTLHRTRTSKRRRRSPSNSSRCPAGRCRIRSGNCSAFEYV